MFINDGKTDEITCRFGLLAFDLRAPLPLNAPFVVVVGKVPFHHRPLDLCPVQLPHPFSVHLPHPFSVQLPHPFPVQLPHPFTVQLLHPFLVQLPHSWHRPPRLHPRLPRLLWRPYNQQVLHMVVMLLLIL